LILHEGYVARDGIGPKVFASFADFFAPFAVKKLLTAKIAEKSAKDAKKSTSDILFPNYGKV
jgi:hypothetical protein